MHPWRKSTYSASMSNCVELATTGADVYVRDSKHPGAGHLTFTRAELAALVAAAPSRRTRRPAGVVGAHRERPPGNGFR